MSRMEQPVELPDDVVAEILFRIAASSVLRCRAVCRRWRRLADDPSFLAARARRRPLEVLAYTTFPEPGGALHVALDTVPVPAGGMGRRLARYPKFLPDAEGTAGPAPPGPQYCLLLASCDGLLLLRQDPGLYLVCNPATRRWTDLPRLTPSPCSWAVASGFYFHRPSGEYRLMCHGRTPDGSAYYVLSAGGAEPHRLGVPAAPVPEGSGAFSYSTPVVHQGSLHWLQHPEAMGTGSVVVFDTVAEEFRRMAAPPGTREYVKLFEVDGVLMVSDARMGCFDLWALVDYGRGEWERRHRVTVPWRFSKANLQPDQRKLRKYLLSAPVAGVDGGDVILGSSFGFVVYNVREKKMVRTVDLECKDAVMSRHVFRESLVQHPFFDARPWPGLPLLQFS